MKKLYKRLAATFLFSAVLSVILFTVSLFERGKEENGRYLDQLLVSAQANLEQAFAEYEEQIEYLKEDYKTRARTVEYIAANNMKMIDRESLEILKNVMEAGNISLLDSSGKIFLSTDHTLEGSREEVSIPEIPEHAEEMPVAVRMDRPDFRNRPEYFYAVAASDSGKFGGIRIDADLPRADLLSGKEIVSAILRQAMTEYDTSIFAVGKAKGQIFGITKNNRQDISLRGIQEGEELLDYLEGLPKEKSVILYINGAYQSAVVRDMEDMYLVAFSGLDKVAGNVLLTFWIGLAMIGSVSILTVLMVHYHLKKYLFGHFEQIRERIYGIIRGDCDPEEGDSEIPELKPLMEMILQLEKGYVEKANGIDRMETQLCEARTEAEYDRLTGLYNRNGFERRAEQFLKEETPEGTLILLDLDNFKKVNDFEGHPEGDRVLRRFAECLASAFRQEDVVGRLGGDEFAVLICNPVPCEIMEEKFSQLLSEVRTIFAAHYAQYHVSASIGAAPVDGTVRDYRKLYRCADTALYISKYAGKDCFYFNQKMIDCMRRECVGCRENCPRSRILAKGFPKEEDR